MQDVIQNVINALSLGSLYALFALGVAVVFGIMQLINFAHGELIMVGAYALVFLHVPWLALIPLTIIVVVVVAMAMERAAFRPVRQANPATLLITSFAISYLLQNLAMLIIGATPKSAKVSTSILDTISLGGEVAVPKLSIVTIVVAAAALAALVAFLGRTPIGMQMRAAAEDFETARLVGVRANTVIATAFVISGIFAAIAALLLVQQVGVVQPAFGLQAVLVGFVAVVLGGMGSLPGAVLGGFILGFITVGLQEYLPLELRYYRDALTYGVVIAMLLVRPQGLIVPRWMRTRV
jgi:branched-chain amino acid transport system permease protein